MRASCSIATTVAPVSSSALVSPPGPGPISRITSPTVAPLASAIRLSSAGSCRKCCPSDLRARTSDSDHKQGNVVIGIRAEGTEILQDPLHQLLGIEFTTCLETRHQSLGAV